jgi:hypothetical protein
MIQFFDSSLLIAAAASFVAGVIGYIIARFWVRPIVRYTITKRKIKRDLSNYLAFVEINKKANDPLSNAGSSGVMLKKAKQYTMELTSCYTKELPYWYRLLLDSRGESPVEASGLLTNLSKIKDNRQVNDRIVRAQEKLGI